ncbi:DUF1659 domain-containing protein [Neobacillus sp. LXY-1]|uniref:DUF1659 domain-containing protein n=1 Tax=Neobacillus sp. LXY-1 TaxID=3379133 RepID=UPI003EE2EDBC
MANTLLTDTQLRVVYQVGIDDQGKPVLKNKNFNNIKTDASADQLIQTAQAIAALAGDTLYKIERNDSSELLA